MIRKRQPWDVGDWVRVGFLTLRVTAREPPDAYRLTNRRGDRQYRYLPHVGLRCLRR